MNELTVELDPRESVFKTFVTKDNRVLLHKDGNIFTSDSVFRDNETGLVEPVGVNGNTLGVIRVNGEDTHYCEYTYVIKKFKKCN